MLRPDAGIIEPRRNRMRVLDLAITIHQEIGAVAMQHARPPARDRGGVQLREPVAGSLDAENLDRGIVEEGVKQPHRIGAAADAGHKRVRQAAFGLLQLRAGLNPDHRLEIAHHHRIGMRPCHGADAVERIVHIGDPIAQRLVHRILERARARLHRDHRGAQHFHADDIGLLPLDVDRSHIDEAFQPEARAQRGGRDAMLAGTGFGDNAPLAHAPGHHDLAEHVVDLVRSGVIELLALEIDFSAAKMFGQPLGEIQRRRPADIVLEIAVHLGMERGIDLGLGISLLQIEDQRHQGFRDEAAAENTEMPVVVGTGSVGIGETLVHRTISSSVARAARTKARIISGSFRPGALSTPEETSTPPARVTRTASVTLPALNPPETMNGISRSRFSRRCQSNTAPRPPGRVASLGAWASNRMRSATSAYPGRLTRSAEVATAIAFITGRPNLCLMSRTRTTLSRPWSCKISGCRASTMPASVASSASTVRATFEARRLTCLPRSRAVARPRWRGDGGKKTKPTMSAPASSATSSVSRVERPQILTIRDMSQRHWLEEPRQSRRGVCAKAAFYNAAPCLSRPEAPYPPCSGAPRRCGSGRCGIGARPRRSASCARASRASASCRRAARRQWRCRNQVAAPPASTPSTATAMMTTKSGSVTPSAGSVELKGSNDTVTRCRLATAKTTKTRPSGIKTTMLRNLRMTLSRSSGERDQLQPPASTPPPSRFSRSRISLPVLKNGTLF